MTNQELKQLKSTLWDAADTMRLESGLKHSEYSTPILGIIFLRFAETKYKKYESKILAEFDKTKGTRTERPIEDIAIAQCGFFLPNEARYDYLLNLSDQEDFSEKIKNAMKAIEKATPDLTGVLPKDEYYSVEGTNGKKVIKRLLKAFKDIPENVGLDIFGEIYEYFLGEFALAEGQGGGEFFTPSTVVRYMVEVLSPTEGEIFDPACGSGGMFVQTAHYIDKHKQEGKTINLRAYGTEKTGATVNLAKMNLALHNIRGTITEANAYYNDPYNSLGRFDYVMANPPFNVDGVELADVKDQERFNKFGIPQNKTKTKSSTPTVPNANYLWINLFATSLKEDTGKAALVMANSASDAGNSEKLIRQKLIESGLVSQMVTLPSNMFSTVTLPATLWFFDASKQKKDEILFIDARNIFTQVDRALRKFSDEQIKNLAIISRLYEGNTEEYDILLKEYKDTIQSFLTSYKKELETLQSVILPENIETVKAINIPMTLTSIENVHTTKNAIEQQVKEIQKTLHLVQAIKKEKGKQSFDTKNYTELSNIVTETLQSALYFCNNALWLQENFPQGTYNDVTGLCKVATIEGEDGIKDQDYSLNPGRYVGVVIEDDGMTADEFKQTMLDLHTELQNLNGNAHELEEKIARNLQELFGE